ncbi:MAG: dipeptidase [Firmicutes bacterium]|nr:dipeptidase [Bacillota bacterium]
MSDFNIPRIIVDSHLDMCMYLRQEHQNGRNGVIKSDYLEDIKAGGVNVIVSALYTDATGINGSFSQQAYDQIAALYAELEATPGLFRLCTSYDEIVATVNAGELAILLSFEGCEPLGNNPELLPLFHRLGVRGLGLAHARRNLACDGARYTSGKYDMGGGLTALGAEFVTTAQRLGMLLDVSHLNDAGTADVLELATGPVIASHSNCRALNPTQRNLPDSLIKAIGDTGGVIGINGCSIICGVQPHETTLSYLVDHIDHMVEVTGWQHVGLGFDLAERIMPGASITVNGTSVPVFDIVKNYAALPQLTAELQKRGYTEEMIDGIYGKNFLRVYKQILK